MKEGFREGLPEPPRRSQDNYVSALIQAHRYLQLAERVGPQAQQRAWAEDKADELREVIGDEIDRFDEVDNA